MPFVVQMKAAEPVSSLTTAAEQQQLNHGNHTSAAYNIGRGCS